MKKIKTADEINTLAGSVSSTSGVYFVTAFSGLLAPYWDPAATGLLVGLTSYTTPAHIARATLEANAFQTHAVIESMKLDSNSELAYLKADGGMTNGDVARLESLDGERSEHDFSCTVIICPALRPHKTLGTTCTVATTIVIQSVRLYVIAANEENTKSCRPLDHFATGWSSSTI
jgi:hypothetical protein